MARKQKWRPRSSTLSPSLYHLSSHWLLLMSQARFYVHIALVRLALEKHVLIFTLLFALDTYFKQAESNEPCTTQLCQWMPPSMQPVEFAMVADIDFSVPKPSASTCSASTSPPVSVSLIFQKLSVPKPTVGKLEEFHSQLAALQPVVNQQFCLLVSDMLKHMFRVHLCHCPYPSLTCFGEEMLDAPFINLLDGYEEIFSSIQHYFKLVASLPLSLALLCRAMHTSHQCLL